MKIRILLVSLSIALSCSFVSAQKPAKLHVPDPGRSGFQLQKNHRDANRGLKEMYSEKWNDSINSYGWKSSVANWTPTMREFRTRSSYGKIGSRLYLSLDTATQQWGNHWLDEMEYSGSAGDLQMMSYKLWEPSTSSWVQYHYEHYSTPGHMDEYFDKGWNPATQKFDYGYRTTYQYDPSGNTADETGQSLDTTTLLWANNYRLTYAYNGASLLVEYISMNWDTAIVDWRNGGKTEYIYDAGNILTETRQYSWYLSTWNLAGRSVFTNNSAGLPTEQLNEYLNGADWDTSSMIQFTYDASDTNMLTMLERNYNLSTHTWTNRYYTTYTYFSNGIKNSYTYGIWNTNSLSWMNSMFTEYDLAGNSIDNYYIAIDGITFQIYYGTRNTETFDANERLLMGLHQIYDTASGGTWLDESRYQETYEDPVNLYYVEELGTKWNGTTWVNDYKDLFYWSYPSGIGNLQNKDRLCFYENPMQEGKPINCPFLDPSRVYRFDLFTMKGENVFSESVAGGKSFCINRTLSPGNYLLKISEHGKTVYRDKVVVVR